MSVGLSKHRVCHDKRSIGLSKHRRCVPNPNGNKKIHSMCLLVLASIAVGRPNPTERKYISRSKHCLCVPKLSVSLSKHWIWASKSVYQSQQALLLS